MRKKMSEKLKDIDSERMLEYLLSKFVEVQIKDNINGDLKWKNL